MSSDPSLPLVIIDYGSGNLRSVAKAFERILANSGKTGHGYTPIISNRSEDVRRADRIVLPGVGAFGDCYRNLAAIPGMIETLEERCLHGSTPFLGICVGMQMMADYGLEHGRHPGLGWIGGHVTHLLTDNPTLCVPHMGWNAVKLPTSPHPLFADIPDQTPFYFVHSYHMLCTDANHCLATVDHGRTMSAAIGRNTMVGVQFHPEKSQAAGLHVLSNFIRWSP